MNAQLQRKEFGPVSWYASIFLDRLRKHTVKIISLGQEINQGHPE
jgi:hypothetical protein